MADDYEQHYLLEAELGRNPRLIADPNLYDFDRQRIYAAYMAALAEPLPNGEESPFSAQDPGSGHGLLGGALIHIQELGAHRLNLVANATWIRIARMLGAELDAAEYAIINLVFTRAPEAIAGQIFTEIPLGTVVRSKNDPDLSVVTTRYVSASGQEKTLIVPARLNRVGAMPSMPKGEFSVLPRNLSFIASVENDGIVISPGREPETLPQAMLRIREGIRTGNLGRIAENGEFNPQSPKFYGRCVTARDFEYYGLTLGASKVKMISPGSDAWVPTVVLYPPEISPQLKPILTSMSLEGALLNIRPAEVIPIDGTITVRVVPSLTDAQVRQLAAIAISPKYDQTKALLGDNVPIGLNPPAGIWGDRNFESNLATVLENVDGIIAVPNLSLKHSVTGQPLATIEVKPWHLFEIQSTIAFETKR